MNDENRSTHPRTTVTVQSSPTKTPLPAGEGQAEGEKTGGTERLHTIPAAQAIPGTAYDSRIPNRDRPPTASLIIPVFNVAEYVEQCLASVLTTAATVDLEIIIIDDGSDDESHKIISAILSAQAPAQTLYLRQSNQGLSAVRNRGMALATGDYIAFLDSDDMLTPANMRILLDFARNHQCDLVLGKSQVFDSKTHEVYPFYDDWNWRQLLGGAESRVVSRHEEPALFFLEPNANYRLVRRDLLSRCDCTYPPGRLFEDPPVHYQMLIAATRVGLVDIPYYWYRVNRPGKITAERSRRRFDIIAVSRETFDRLGGTDVTAEAGGAIIYGLARILWWCGTMTLPEHRREYFEQACQVFARYAPRPWIRAFRAHHFPDRILHVVVDGLMQNESAMLERISYRRRQRWRSFLFLLKNGRTDILLDRVHAEWKAALTRTRSKIR